MRQILKSLSIRTFAVMLATVLPAISSGIVRGDTIFVANPGFEDISVGVPFNEFTFGAPNGWDLYDPDNITGGGAGPVFFVGTLTPTGSEFFTSGAPEGQRVAIAFNFEGSGGQGEYGLIQTLTTTLQANTQYTLNVDIGNIASGTAVNGDFFDLNGFPGYRVDLLAGGVVVAQDDNSLAGSIAEGAFGLSTVNFTTGDLHAQLGQQLAIRLVNLNVVDPAFPGADLEVDFDNVRLMASSAVPEPGTFGLLTIAAAAGAVFSRRRHSIRISESVIQCSSSSTD